MTTKSSGFTLIELLVVVGILGILAAVGLVSYSGYVEGSKRKTAENVLMQLALGQTEYYADFNSFYKADNCTRGGAKGTTTTDVSSDNIEEFLLGGMDSITPEMGYNFCAGSDPGGSNFMLFAVERDAANPCIISMEANNKFVRLRKDGTDC